MSRHWSDQPEPPSKRYSEDRAYNSTALAARIGRGEKLYAASVMAVRFDSEADARRLGYRREQMSTDEHGSLWGIQMTCCVRNRTAHVFGWQDAWRGTVTAARTNTCALV